MNFSLQFPALYLAMAVLLCGLNGVQGNAKGAPTTEETCANMTPKHGDIKPQEIPFPYTIYMSRTEVKGGEMIKIMICSTNDKIKGFYLQGRKLNDKEMMPMGTFVLEENFMGAKLVNCGKGMGNTVTHVDNMDKDHVKVQFMAPKEPGTYVILCTVAKNGGVFWTKQPSFKITVKP